MKDLEVIKFREFLFIYLLLTFYLNVLLQA